MAGFLYFVSGDNRPLTLARVAELGLGYAFRSGKIENRGVGVPSPSGKQGNVCWDHTRAGDRDAGYYPDKQTWRKMPPRDGRPELWLGYWNDAKPRPAELARRDALPGLTTYELSPGNVWRIPTLAEWDAAGEGPCQLPSTEDYDGDGVLQVQPPTGDDGDLWAMIHPLAMALLGLSPASPTLDEYRAGAVALIGRNYAVDMPELAVLGSLARDSRYENIIMASVRGQWLLEAISAATDEQKKTESPPTASGTSISGGAAA